MNSVSDCIFSHIYPRRQHSGLGTQAKSGKGAVAEYSLNYMYV